MVASDCGESQSWVSDLIGLKEAICNVRGEVPIESGSERNLGTYT